MKELIDAINFKNIDDDNLAIFVENYINKRNLDFIISSIKKDLSFYHFSINLLEISYVKTLDLLIKKLPNDCFKRINDDFNYFFTDHVTLKFFDCKTFEKYADLFKIDVNRVLNNYFKSQKICHNLNFWNSLKSNPDFIANYIKNDIDYIRNYILYANFKNKSTFKIENKNEQLVLNNLLELIKLKKEDLDYFYTEFYIKAGYLNRESFDFIKRKSGRADYPNLKEQKELLNILDDDVIYNFPEIKEIVFLNKVKTLHVYDLTNSAFSLLYFKIICKYDLNEKFEDIKNILINDENLIRRYYRDQNLQENMEKSEIDNRINKISDLLLDICEKTKLDPLLLIKNIKRVRNYEDFLKNYEFKLLNRIISKTPEGVINKKRL